MKPTYYLKTIMVKGENRFKIVANYGVHRSYLLGKSFTWDDLKDFVLYGTRLVIDNASELADDESRKSLENLFGLESKLWLEPGFNMTRNLQPIKIGEDPIKVTTNTVTVVRQIPCATDCGCGPAFMEDTYFDGTEPDRPLPTLKQPKGSLWVRIFGS